MIQRVVVPKMQRVVSVPFYWVIVGTAVMVCSPVLSVLAATTISERNAERQVAAVQVAKEQATAESKRITCNFFSSSLDVYKEVPPETKAGKAQQENYAELYRISGCQPPRTK